MKILAFAASTSKHSINKKLVTYAANMAASLQSEHEIEILDLNDYELPLFSVDKEQQLGQPEIAKAFFNKITHSDAVLISFAEHNRCYSAAYKNLFDWCSRINTKVFQGKPMVMLSTSPGARGGASVLAIATSTAAHFGGDLKASLSVPGFNENFDDEQGVLKSVELQQQLFATVSQLFR